MENLIYESLELRFYFIPTPRIWDPKSEILDSKSELAENFDNKVVKYAIKQWFIKVWDHTTTHTHLGYLSQMNPFFLGAFLIRSDAAGQKHKSSP